MKLGDGLSILRSDFRLVLKLHPAVREEDDDKREDVLIAGDGLARLGWVDPDAWMYLEYVEVGRVHLLLNRRVSARVRPDGWCYEL